MLTSPQKSAGLELGTHEIAVNAVIPGLIDTPLTRHEERNAQALQEGGEEPAGDPAADQAKPTRPWLPGRPRAVPWVEPDAVAPVILFLAPTAPA